MTILSHDHLITFSNFDVLDQDNVIHLSIMDVWWKYGLLGDVHEHLSWIVVSLKVSCISLFYSIACRKGRKRVLQNVSLSYGIVLGKFPLKYEGVPALTCTETFIHQTANTVNIFVVALSLRHFMCSFFCIFLFLFSFVFLLLLLS